MTFTTGSGDYTCNFDIDIGGNTYKGSVHFNP